MLICNAFGYVMFSLNDCDLFENKTELYRRSHIPVAYLGGPMSHASFSQIRCGIHTRLLCKSLIGGTKNASPLAFIKT